MFRRKRCKYIKVSTKVLIKDCQQFNFSKTGNRLSYFSSLKEKMKIVHRHYLLTSKNRKNKFNFE